MIYNPVRQRTGFLSVWFSNTPQSRTRLNKKALANP